MKASSQQKQLNIRSDEAYETAHRLSRALKLPAHEIVLRALRRMASETEPAAGDLPADVAAANRERLREARRAAWSGKTPPRGLTSDHDWLYDENGLPK